MIQAKEQIKREIKKMQKYNKNSKEDIITSRIVYLCSELLRWSIEDTVGWEKPLQSAISHAKILKDELGDANQKQKEVNR